MKTLFLIASLFLTGLAQADPVLLYQDGCSRIRLCSQIQNSGSYEIDLYANTANTSVTLTVDGLPYYSPTGNAESTSVAPNLYSAQITDLLLTAPDGKTVVLNVTFSGYHHLINSGRAHWWVTDWTLVEGSVTGLDPQQ